MYALPILFEGRRMHYLQLDKTDENNTTLEFTALRDWNKKTELLRIHNGTMLLGSENYHHIPLLGKGRLCHAEISAMRRGQQLELTLLIKNGNKAFSKREGTDEALRKANITLTLPTTQRPESPIVLYTEGQNKTISSIHFKVEFSFYNIEDEKQIKLSDALLLHLPQANHQDKTKRNVYYGVFDFGSEASQIGVKSPNSKRFDFINVVRTIERNFHQFKGGDRTYLQQLNNDELFLSRIFLRKKVSTHFSHIAPPQNPYRQKNGQLNFNQKTDGVEFINILTSDAIDPFRERQLAPNLKLSILKEEWFNYKVEFEDATHNPEGVTTYKSGEYGERIFRGTLNQFIHVILSEINQSLNNERPGWLHLTLLVPNVYDQERINLLINNLNQDIRAILNATTKNGQSLYPYHIKGFEIDLLSESDASFLGMVDKNIVELEKDDLCLVIDAGKGTIDFSILKADDNDGRHFSSLYRSGFVGAGNVLTYAFLETILGFYLDDDKEKVEEFLEMEILKQPEQILVNKLMHHIEALKKGYGSYSSSKRQLKTLQKGLDRITHTPFDFETQNQKENIRKLINAIQMDFFKENPRTQEDELRYTIKDEYGIVDNTVSVIVDRLRKALSPFINTYLTQGKKFKKVLLAGRTFKFSLLKNAVEDALAAHTEGGKTGIYFYAENPKQICAYGVGNERVGSINMGTIMTGIPIIANSVHSQRTTTTNAPTQKSKQKFKQKSKPSSKKKSTQPKKKRWWEKLADAFVGLAEEENPSSPTPLQRYIPKGKVAETIDLLDMNFFLQGFGNCTNADKIELNDRKLKTYHAASRFSLFFAGRKNWEALDRTTGKVISLIISNSKYEEDIPLFFKSLFPAISPDMLSKIDIPEPNIGLMVKRKPQPQQGNNSRNLVSAEQRSRFRNRRNGREKEEVEKVVVTRDKPERQKNDKIENSKGNDADWGL